MTININQGNQGDDQEKSAKQKRKDAKREKQKDDSPKINYGVSEDTSDIKQASTEIGL